MTETLLDASLTHRFCPSLGAAEEDALREAADTGGVLLRVRGLRIEPNSLVITGKLPTIVLAVEDSSSPDAHAHPRAVGTLRMTWQGLVQPNADEEIGYLVLQAPVLVREDASGCEEDDHSWVSVAVPRTHHTLKPAGIGAACCARCHRPIPGQRLLAVPNTRHCTNCQQKKENA